MFSAAAFLIVDIAQVHVIFIDLYKEKGLQLTFFLAAKAVLGARKSCGM